MKLLDKLKNALFEEEYVEVEEETVKPKKEKRDKKEKKDINKIKDEKRLRDIKITDYNGDDEDLEHPIAKKIVVDDSIREIPKENKLFEEDVIGDDISYFVPEEEQKKEEFKFPTITDDDFITEPDEVKVTEIEIPKEESKAYKGSVIYEKPVQKEKEVKLYKTSKEEEYIKNYTAQEYGNYEKAKEKKIFKPSPNISPIYGIIDERKTSVKVQTKPEVRLTSAIRNEKVDVDDIRKKAFGTIEDDLRETIGTDDFINREQESAIEEESSLVDLRYDDAPEVNKITMGDAEEYFQDLGLEYDTDYIDARKAKASGRRLKSEDEYQSPKIEEQEEDLPIFLKEKKDIVIDEKTNLNDDDNLFDLIDSMYDK